MIEFSGKLELRVEERGLELDWSVEPTLSTWKALDLIPALHPHHYPEENRLGQECPCFPVTVREGTVGNPFCWGTLGLVTEQVPVLSNPDFLPSF